MRRKRRLTARAVSAVFDELDRRLAAGDPFDCAWPAALQHAVDKLGSDAIKVTALIDREHRTVIRRDYARRGWLGETT